MLTTERHRLEDGTSNEKWDFHYLPFLLHVLLVFEPFGRIDLLVWDGT